MPERFRRLLARCRSSCPRGWSGVRPRGSIPERFGLLILLFARAPLLEVVEDVARVFSAPILCPEPAASEFTGSFSADRLSEALARVASGTGRRARLDGAAWTVEPDLPEDPREVTWSDPCFSAGEAQGP